MMRTTDDLRLPAEFDMPPSRRRLQRELLATEFSRGGSSVSRRRRGRRWTLTLAGAACVAVAAVPALDLLSSNSSGSGVVEKAVAAVSSEHAIYHVVSLFTVRYETDDPRVLDAFDLEDVDLFENVTQYWEAWIGPGNRNHTLLYAADGRERGRLLMESTSSATAWSSFDAESNTLSIGRVRKPTNAPRVPPHPQGPVPPDLSPSEDPAVQLRRLHEQRRLRVAGTEDVHGRRAYRLVSDTWIDPSEKGHTERVEFVVDAETYLPIEQRNVSTQLGVPGLEKEVQVSPEMWSTPVTSIATRQFLTYERLAPSEENRAKLEPLPHPGAKVFDPHVGPRDRR